MESIKFAGEKIYKVNLEVNDILIVAIPSNWYNRINALEKVNELTKNIEEHFEKYDVNNPILVLPDDINVFNLKVKGLQEMVEIDPELDGFEDDFTL